jgi:hypothetical protein
LILVKASADRGEHCQAAGVVRDETKWRAQQHLTFTPRSVRKTRKRLTIFTSLVLGSYELEAAEKAKQIEGQSLSTCRWNDDSQKQLNNAPTIYAPSRL